MKIHKVILENFRAFYGKVEIPLEDFTVFLGKNDQGKSSILEAKDVFVNEGKGSVKIDNNDLNQKAKNENVDSFKIGIIFKDLPEEIIIDETNRTSLRDEFLLTREDFLEIWKTFKNAKIQNVTVKCYHPANDDFLKDLMKKKIKELQDFVKENKINTSTIDNRKSAGLRKIIRDYYKQRDGELKLEEIEININDEGLKEIWSKLQNYLPTFALFHSDRKNLDQDDEIQDPLKYKVDQIFKKDDIRSKLNEIAQQIENEIKQIADSTVQKFNELNKERESINIVPNIPDVADLKWKDVYKGIGYNTDNNIPLNKRGSGIRRLVLVSSFLAEVERKSNQDNKNHIIYAIEEPETSLHPDLQIKFINALQQLSRNKNYQIILTTHSPALIRLFETKSIRYVDQSNNVASVKEWDESVASTIIKNLGLLPTIGKVVICVEGSNDEMFLLNINENIPELKNIVNLKENIKSGLISIIPMNGSNLKHWIDKYSLKNTNVVEYHLYDKDKDEKYKKEVEKVNKRSDGSKAVLTQKREIENYIPQKLIEFEFKIKLDIKDWDNAEIAKAIRDKLPNRDESNIKAQLCGSVAKKIKKEDLESLNAWMEVKGWFYDIANMVQKVTKQ